MGNDLRHKGLLLDEADFALPQNCNMTTLIRAVEDYCEAEFSNEFDDPSLEIFGVVSEGFDDTSVCPFDSSKAVWIKPGIGFRDIFLGMASELDIPETLAAEAIDTGRTDGIETHLKNRTMTHFAHQDYHDAQRLMRYMPELGSIGLPGVRGADEFSTHGNDMVVDYRINNYGPGRRILVEIAFNWGQ